jgi:hypothetical protein
MPWKEVRRHKGLNYKPVDNYVLRLPRSVPPDETICEFTVDSRRRVFGFRNKRTFYFIWFDREHKVIPQNKNKKQRKGS